MAHRPRSLQHEYELFVDREIEAYKESVSRSVLLSLGDEAVQSLASQQQLALTEILLAAEVDRIIRARLRLPKYVTWRRRRLRSLKEFSRPERWGLRPDGAIARTAHAAADGHVLIAGATEEGPALYLAANGCAVTTIDRSDEIVERVMNTAMEVGLTGRLRGFIGELAHWAPDIPLRAVLCGASALHGLTPDERAHTLALLQAATTDGGLHVVETVAAGEQLLSLEELEATYDGWQITVEREVQRGELLIARKAVA